MRETFPADRAASRARKTSFHTDVRSIQESSAKRRANCRARGCVAAVPQLRGGESQSESRRKKSGCPGCHKRGRRDRPRRGKSCSSRTIFFSQPQKIVRETRPCISRRFRASRSGLQESALSDKYKVCDSTRTKSWRRTAC